MGVVIKVNTHTHAAFLCDCQRSALQIQGSGVLSVETCATVLNQIRIPTCYDKPGTSQLVQSAQVTTRTERVNITPHKICIHTRRASLRSRVTVRCPSCSRPSTKWTSSGEPCRCFSIPGGLPPPAVRGRYCRTSVHYPSRRSLPKIPGCSQASCCILQRAEPARSSDCSEGQSSSSLSVPFAGMFQGIFKAFVNINQRR